MFGQQLANKEPLFGPLNALPTRLPIDEFANKDAALGLKSPITIRIPIFKFPFVDEFLADKCAFAIGDGGLIPVAHYCAQVVGFVRVQQQGVRRVDVLLLYLRGDDDRQVACLRLTFYVEHALSDWFLVLDVSVEVELEIQAVIPFQTNILSGIWKASYTFYGQCMGTDGIERSVQGRRQDNRLDSLKFKLDRVEHPKLFLLDFPITSIAHTLLSLYNAISIISIFKQPTIIYLIVIQSKATGMQQQDTIGAIRVPRMIWTATALSLGAIYYCWFNYNGLNPSIMTTALEYPYTIILRVGLMYSLFIMFLISFFIKWWLDNSQRAKHTTKALVAGLVCLASYGLFVSTIDRKRINYVLAEWAVFVACVTNFFAISTIFKNIKAIREVDPYFISHKSWKLKKAFYTLFAGFMLSGLLVYLGQLSIEYKNKIEYGVVTTSYLFYWSFVYDFKGHTMDIQGFAEPGKSQ